MALQKQIVNLPLVGTKTENIDDFLNQGFIQLTNVYSKKDGMLAKRTGYKSLAGLGTVADDIFSYNSELLAAASTNLYTYAPSRDSWVSKGIISGTTGTLTQVLSGPTTYSQCDYVEANGIGLLVYMTGGKLYADLIDVETGAKFSSRTLLSSNTTVTPIAIATGVSLLCIWAEGTAIHSALFSTETPEQGLISSATTITDSNASPVFDATTLGSNIVIGYKQTGGNLKLAYLTQNNIPGNPLAGLPNAVLTSYTVDGPIAMCTLSTTPTESFSIAGSLTGNLRLETYDSLFSLTDSVSIGALTGANVNTIGIVEQTASPRVVSIIYSTTSFTSYTCSVNITANTNTSSVLFRSSSSLISRPFISGGKLLAYMGHYRTGTLQETYFLVDFTNNQISGRFLYSGAGVVLAGFTARKMVQRVTLITDYHKIALLNKARIGNDFLPIYGVSILQTSTNTPRTALNANGILLISGGFAQRYEGKEVTELGFLLGPDNLTFTSTAATGGSMASGVYNYIAVYEWSDGLGNSEFSTPSVVLPVTVSATGTTNKVVITVPTLAWTQKTAIQPNIGLYRTKAGGTVFYKVSSETNPTQNTFAADSITITDTLNDTSLDGKQLLYTTGDVVENVATPGFTTSVICKQRVFVGGGECGGRVYYSKQFEQGTAPEFNDGFFITVGDTVTALAELDDKLIIFTASTTYVVSGEGPEPTGINNTFSQPFRVSADIGCSIPDSIDTIPAGLVFASAKGLFILDRGMNAQYFGDAVENINDLTVIGSVVVSTNQDVLFSTREGITYRYDWKGTKWSTYESQPSSASLIWQGKHTYLDTAGIVWVSESTNTDGSTRWTDGGIPYSSRIETGWLQVNQLNGFQRIWGIMLLGRLIGDHRLVVKLRYDNVDTDREILTIDPSTAILSANYGVESPYGDDVGKFGGEKDGVYRFQVKPAVQKCRCIKIIIEDSFLTSADEGSFELAGLSLIAGVRPSTGKMGAGRTLKAK